MTDNTLSNEQEITRQQFFLYAWAATAFVLFGAGIGVVFKFLQPRVEEGAFGGLVTAGKVEDFPVGSVTTFRKSQFFLVRLEGGFLAEYRVCTHLGCIVYDWDEEQQRFLCPCHVGVFNKEGEVLAGPPPRPADLFPVEIVEGEVLVDTGTVVRRSSFEESQLARV